MLAPDDGSKSVKLVSKLINFELLNKINKFLTLL